MWRVDGGSLADRMRSLEIQSSLLRKQDPMMDGGMPTGVDPTTAVSTAPVAQLFNEVDRGISDLMSKMNSLTHLLDDQRSAGIEAQVLAALQMDMKQLEMAVLGLKQPLAMIKAKHASVVQMQPMGPMGNLPDPMMAASQQQAPANMPAMGGDMMPGAAPGGF